MSHRLPCPGWGWPLNVALVSTALVSAACGLVAPLEPLNRTHVEDGEWTRQFGSLAEDIAYAVTGDAEGNVYVAGATWSALPGQVHAGDEDIFLRKYDGGGVELWTRQFGTAGPDAAYGVGTDKDGNVYIAGSVSDALFGQTGSPGNQDAFLRKYDSSGAEQWTRQFGGDSGDIVNSLSLDVDGNVYVAGLTSSAPGGQKSDGNFDAILRKYDSAGAELWTRQFGSSNDDIAQGVTVDENRQVYVVGITQGALAGLASAGEADGFLRKYDVLGNEQWTRQFGTTGGDAAFAVAAVASGVFLAGQTSGALPGRGNAGGDDVFLLKYDAAGSEQWSQQFGTAGDDNATALRADGNGGVYLAGYLGDAAAPGQADAGLTDAFLRNYDASGNLGFAEQVGSSGHDAAYSVYAGRGVLLLSGSVDEALPGQSWLGDTDAFVMRLQR